jgi:DNA-binding response OmpR family regulator
VKLLIVEDSEPLNRSLCIGFENLGFTVEASYNGQEALTLLSNNNFDLVILDIMLPGIDGFTILKKLKATKAMTRVIVLSAKSQLEDKINGLQLGADDYLAKPFSFTELQARVEAVLRRGSLLVEGDSNVVVADFMLDPEMKSLSYQANEITLTHTEYKIIACIFAKKGKVVTSEHISEMVVGDFDMLSKNTIEAHLSSVRRKARQAGGELPIKNKRGFGYFTTS